MEETKRTFIVYSDLVVREFQTNDHRTLDAISVITVWKSKFFTPIFSSEKVWIHKFAFERFKLTRHFWVDSITEHREKGKDSRPYKTITIRVSDNCGQTSDFGMPSNEEIEYSQLQGLLQKVRDDLGLYRSFEGKRLGSEVDKLKQKIAELEERLENVIKHQGKSTSEQEAVASLHFDAEAMKKISLAEKIRAISLEDLGI